MNGKKIVASTLLAAILLSVVIVPLSTQQGGSTYDAWLDYNEDGVIDVNDLHPLGGAYGTTGDSTKNVNVTNWPIDYSLFPENLILRGAFYFAGAFFEDVRRDLFDATSMHPHRPMTYFYDTTYPIPLSTISTLMYNNTYIYQKIPTRVYQISGVPALLLSLNVTSSVSVVFYIEIQARLGQISRSGQWTQLAYLGYHSVFMMGRFTDYPATRYFSPAAPIDALINANERLAIRILIYGHTESGTTDVTVNLLPDADTDHFMVDVPIIRNPPSIP